MQHRNERPGAIVGHITKAVRTGGITRDAAPGSLAAGVGEG